MEFSEYLIQKKISPQLFREGDPARYREWSDLFETMHPESFTAQKKFLVNEIRRRYHLPDPDR
ncbi:hypothetical protein [Dyadobacter sandarakinus]|uniref:Uncharacterized protein n=1 Tax=Dyadobacter sandarakinus TaxID=2747268 RepID=A0ABX7IC90_9BACT|nr:hypothetical protein [Dyadobacter sandarakinus]QRR03540.1 hypothetical protein HWI92_22805 [Dyadobacter sandarakinus]